MNGGDLRRRASAYLASHHTMTLATMGLPVASSEVPASAPEPVAAPHAASVFYALDGSMRLVFLSKPSSLHGVHIGEGGPVAATVSEDYGDWELIQGVQLWGDARLLKGAARAAAMALYVARFPFVSDLLKQPRLAELIAGIGVYRITPRRLAFTDNTTGVFGREVLEVDT